MFSADMITGGAPAAPAPAADASSLDLVRAAMREKPPKVASAYDAVYNDECMLSFDTPLSADGLYVSLTSFQGFGAEHVALDHEKTGNRLYVHFKHTRVAASASCDPSSESFPIHCKTVLGKCSSKRSIHTGSLKQLCQSAQFSCCLLRARMFEFQITCLSFKSHPYQTWTVAET